jgi:DNA-binding response OmpR family regulator
LGRDWNVLIVEDDGATAELIQSQLGGHRTRLARNGQEAILVAGQTPPGAIVMDLMMPELDGYEAARYFKHKFGAASVPILILTAVSDAKAPRECGEIGCDDFMTKPHDGDALAAAVSDLLAVAEAERALAQQHALRRELDAETDKKKRKLLQKDVLELQPIEDRLCERRAAIAQRLVERGYAGIARNHVVRIEAIRPQHPALSALRAAVE